jgi:hypothetical protein
MQEIRILAGFVRDMRPFSRTSLAFQIGTPPEWIYMGGTTLAPPFSPNEYIAIAVRRSIFSTGHYAVLAFRDAGLSGRPRAVSLVVPIAVAIAGLLLTFVLFAKPPVDSPAIVLPLCGGLMLLGGVHRLLAVRQALYLLEQWQPSVEDIQTHRKGSGDKEEENVETDLVLRSDAKISKWRITLWGWVGRWLPWFPEP